MKKVIFMFALMVGLMSCGGNKNGVSEAETVPDDCVEVIYFHGKQRCATCEAIENNVREVLSTEFADEIEAGDVVLKVIDISTPEGEAVADKYEVTWSSLFVNKWKDGKETRKNMTEFGFGTARNYPQEFKTGLSATINQLLE